MFVVRLFLHAGCGFSGLFSIGWNFVSKYASITWKSSAMGNGIPAACFSLIFAATFSFSRCISLPDIWLDFFYQNPQSANSLHVNSPFEGRIKNDELHTCSAIFFWLASRALSLWLPLAILSEVECPQFFRRCRILGLPAWLLMEIWVEAEKDAILKIVSVTRSAWNLVESEAEQNLGTAAIVRARD